MKKFFYWFGSLTWGLPMTLVGLVATLVLFFKGCKPKKFGLTYYFETGKKNWGGVSLGAMFITSPNPSLDTLCHEHGHCFQNLIFGIFMPLFVCLPSATRYWMYESKSYKDLIYNGCLIVLALTSLSILCLGVEPRIIKYIGAFLALYTYIFGVWYFADEKFKFKDGNQPIYDEIWFEQTATSLGNKFYAKNCENC